MLCINAIARGIIIIIMDITQNKFKITLASALRVETGYTCGLYIEVYFLYKNKLKK